MWIGTWAKMDSRVHAIPRQTPDPIRRIGNERLARMCDTPTDVLVAGYSAIDAATADVEAYAARVKAKEIGIEGVILVAHAEDGTVTVQQTGDHLGRKGMGCCGGVGAAVGLSRSGSMTKSLCISTRASTPSRTARVPSTHLDWGSGHGT